MGLIGFIKFQLEFFFIWDSGVLGDVGIIYIIFFYDIDGVMVYFNIRDSFFGLREVRGFFEFW